MEVKFISQFPADAKEVPALLDKAGVKFEPIACVNWAEYPYKPAAAFRIAYTKSGILVHYQVTEKSIRARYAEDNGQVWTDSCMEFFSIPASDGIYYNMECNCAGTLLIGAGEGRNGRELAPLAVTSLVKRWSSLGRAPFEEKIGEVSWQMALAIPFEAYFKHHITSLAGKVVRANFYKCGDELQTPHFLSWNPIRIAQPDFHRPDFFGQLEFAQ